LGFKSQEEAPQKRTKWESITTIRVHETMVLAEVGEKGERRKKQVEPREKKRKGAAILPEGSLRRILKKKKKRGEGEKELRAKNKTAPSWFKKQAFRDANAMAKGKKKKGKKKSQGERGGGVAFFRGGKKGGKPFLQKKKKKKKRGPERRI